MSREIGAAVEAEATQLLKKNNYKILTNNFTTKFGEIDIIALDKVANFLVFVEVKYRKTDQYGGAIEMLSLAKQKKLFKTAQIYMMKNKRFENMDYRFDLIAKTGAQINWVKNVIEAF
ncbi:YraN family protein [Francisellaceae bacterium]|nr:YraN family protein [Francisellaceae bacterium]